MSKRRSECPDPAYLHRSIAVSVLLRQEPDEDDEDEGDGREEDDEDDTGEGYSE